MLTHQEQPDDGADRRIACPKDCGEMTKIKVGSITADRCARCGGMWFDALELETLLTTKSAAKQLDWGRPSGAPDRAPDTPLLCPRDRSTLIRMVDIDQPHVTYDGCTVCGGVYLDSGELVDLSEVTLRERLRNLFRL